MRILVTGGCGFIGLHTAAYYMDRGAEVHVVDNCSREGTLFNLDWLKRQGAMVYHECDIRDLTALQGVFRRVGPLDAIIHLAGQVAVTVSLEDPVADLQANGLGTLHVLEATRKHSPDAAFLYASTNKVYGGLEHLVVRLRYQRYEFTDYPLGIDESQPLDFHSPYGCSKGVGDQYVKDYHRIFGLKTVVFRQGCIYGTHQYGVEDQGWVAWMCIAATMNLPFTIYGDGKQVRDLLYVDDLVAAYDKAIDRIDTVCGEVFNLGGGAANSLSLLELIALLRDRYAKPIEPTYEGWRPGDQQVCIMNTAKAQNLLGWVPQVIPHEGIDRLMNWIEDTRPLGHFVRPIAGLSTCQTSLKRNQKHASIPVPKDSKSAGPQLTTKSAP